MARRNFDSTDLNSFLNYAWPVYGTQAVTATTATITLATIEATDIVSVTPITLATAAYIITVSISAGVGFVVTLNTNCGTGTLHYAVFKRNS